MHTPDPLSLSLGLPAEAWVEVICGSMDDFSGDTTNKSDAFSPSLVVFETESHSITQVGLEVIAVLSQSLEF